MECHTVIIVRMSGPWWGGVRWEAATGDEWYHNRPEPSRPEGQLRPLRLTDVSYEALR